MDKKNVFEIRAIPEVPKKIYPVKVPGYHSTNYDLGRAIMGMRYDQVCEVFRGMFDALGEEIFGDTERGRVKLVKQLSNAWMYLSLTRVYLEKAFRVCRPFMSHELNRGKIVTLKDSEDPP